MKTKTFLGLSIILMLGSCQQTEVYDDALTTDLQSENATTRSISAKSRSLPTEWEQLQTHDQMLASLQIANEELANLSTTDLVEACVNYPLSIDCFMYNDFNHGLKVIMDNFNGFKELQTRDDAMLELISYYENFLQQLDYVVSYSEEDVNPFEFAFIELMLSSGEFGDISQFPQTETLLDRSDKIRYRLNSLSGDICETVHTQLLTKVFGSKGYRSPSSQSTVTIYTKNGFAVKAINRICNDNSAERISGLNYILEKYPNVEIVGDASCTYNCHAYAWYVSEGGEKYWINCGDDVYHPTNLSKFWEDGYYKECSSNEAEKVFYDNGGDHSALVINDNLYESKWGAFYVVRHEPDYCPYGTSRKFYAHNPSNPMINPDVDPGPAVIVKYGTTQWNFFPDPTPAGSTESFWIDDNWDSRFFRTEVFVSGAKEPDEPLDDTSRYTIVSSTNSSADVIFHKTGIYYVCFRIYHKATGTLQASYTSAEVYVQ